MASRFGCCLKLHFFRTGIITKPRNNQQHISMILRYKGSRLWRYKLKLKDGRPYYKLVRSKDDRPQNLSSSFNIQSILFKSFQVSLNSGFNNSPYK